MKEIENTKNNAARLRSLRAHLGLDQDKMGSLLGVSREWISKLENGREQFSEFVLMKMRDASHGVKSVASEVAPHDVQSPPQAAYGISEQIEELKNEFDQLIAAAKMDPQRLGWIAEQMRAHLSVPRHWRTNEELNQLARRAVAEHAAEREREGRALHPQAQRTQESA